MSVAAIAAVVAAASLYYWATAGRLTAFERGVVKSTRLGERGHTLGPSEAPLKLVEFSDFECPFCRSLHEAFTELRERYPTEVAIVYWHYPLKGHPYAFDAAVAAECAADAGHFETFTDRLFAKQESLGVTSWELLALAAGVTDTAAFRACRYAGDANRRVAEDIEVGSQLGIQATPVLVVGRKLIVGSVTADSLEKLVRPLFRR